MTTTGSVRRPVGQGREIAMASPWFDEREVVAAAAAVQSGLADHGARVAEFEEMVAAVVQAPFAVAVSSCSAALHLGLVAHGVGPGDDVVVPSLASVATAHAVRHVGARPVFADVDPRHHNVTAETVEAALTPETAAVIVVDQYGTPAELEPIRSLVSGRGVALVEDAAGALGSVRGERPVGAGSEFAAFSFHRGSILVTGEGGMIATTDPALAERLRRLRRHGMSGAARERHPGGRRVVEHCVETGYSYGLTDIQAAIGIVQASKLQSMVERRRDLARRYQELLADVPGLVMATDPDCGRANYQAFWVMLPDDFPVSRDDLLTVLDRHGISARRGIPCAHEEPAFNDLEPVSLPVSERAARQSVRLPMFHALTDEDQRRVAEVVRDVWADPRGIRD